jgi:predicted DNA-binding protein (UPF0251 family)
VALLPQANYYRPRDIPLSVLEEVILTVDEFEAIRLNDLEGAYQTKAAEQMSISRQTLGGTLESAHQKIADALVHEKALLIKGGSIEIIDASSETVGPHRFRYGSAARTRRSTRKNPNLP